MAKVSLDCRRVRRVKNALAAYVVVSREGDSSKDKKDRGTDKKCQFRLKEQRPTKRRRFSGRR